MEIPTTDERGIPLKLAQLRAKLGLKAKQEPNFRFYTLYNHLIRMDVLETAWKMVLRNGGTEGYDGVTLKDVQKRGVQEFLQEIQESLTRRTYQADPVRRVYIPKSDGSLRPLGIPTVKDRVVQAALMLIIEPIFEADFLECSYGFRPEKSAHQAIDAIVQAVQAGQLEVYDADLEKYFDSIPHDKLMKAVEKRIIDSRVLQLIRMWLKAPVWEEGKTMTSNERGTPQGGVISPLLSNLYLHWFDKVFQSSKGPGTWAKATIIRYADDFVILAKYMSPRIQAWIQQVLEERFGLKINRDKTKIVDLKVAEATVNFLGFTMKRIGYQKCQVQPMKRSMKRAREAIRRITSPKMGCMPIKGVIGKVNRYLQGWGSYFNKGTPSKAFQDINWYTAQRMSHFLERRSQRGYRRPEGVGWYNVLKGLGLYTLTRASLGKCQGRYKRRSV